MDISFGVDAQTVAIIGFMVIATIKLINSGFDRDFRAVTSILGAALVGAAVGYGIDGLSVVIGAAVGLASSGLITTVGYAKKTTPVAPAPELG